MIRKAHSHFFSAAQSSSIWRRLVPPLAFIAALSLMIVCFYDSGYTSLPPTGKRYDMAKTGALKLRQDAKRAALRESWEKLAAEFQAIYDADPSWPNRPAALFRAAEALEELAHRSFAKADVHKAIECYESVAQRHADSRLADDALFRAAKLRAAWLKDDKTALILLERIESQYPKSDMRTAVQALKKTLQAAAKGRTAPEARQLANTDGKEAIEEQTPTRISSSAKTHQQASTVQARKPVRQGASLAEKAESLPPLASDDLLPRYREAKKRMESLTLDKVRATQRQPWEDLTTEFLRIYQAKKNWAVSPGALFRAAVSLEGLANNSHLKREYRQARDLYLRLAQEFPQSALADDALMHAAAIDADKLQQTAEALELLDAVTTLYSGGDQIAAARNMRSRLNSTPLITAPPTARAPAATLPPQNASPLAAKKSSSRPTSIHSANPRLVTDMARQLGLSVRTVFIDAGHGGRDPGTHHNTVLEREITLDVALTLGRLLQTNGLEVIYSRTKNSTVPLRQRTAMSNAAGTDLFVSIHVNANPNAGAQGFETYYLDMAKTPEAARLAAVENADSGQRLRDMRKMLADVMLNARAGESHHLANDIQRRTISRLKKRKYTVRDNGVKSAPFLVLVGTQMPAVLVELGYCTNKDEAQNLRLPQYRMALAEGLAEGILAYRDRLLKRRTVQNSLTQDSADAM